MRVMVVSNLFPPHVRGGYELGTLDVARAFVAAGHEVEVVTSAAVGVLRKTRPADGVTVRPIFGPVLAYESDLAERLEHSVAWRRQRTDALGGMVPENIVALQVAIQRFRPDRVWVGNPLGLGPVGVLEAALSAAVPVVIHLMDDIDRYLLGYRRPLHWLPRVARLKRAMTAISCASHVRDMNSVVGSYGTHHVVLNGVDFAAASRLATPGQHDGPLRFVYFGQVEPMKGIGALIDAVDDAAAAPGTGPFTLDIIGPASASYARDLHADLAARGLNERVRLVGALDRTDLMARLPTYDAAVLLLKHEEPFGYAWLEAAAAGLPVLITRGRTVADALRDDYPLFVHDRDDRAAVAALLIWCATHRHALSEIGAGLRRHLRAICDTVSAVHPRYLDILEHASAPPVATDLDSLLASALTVDAFGLSSDAAHA